MDSVITLGAPQVVGSFGSSQDLRAAKVAVARECCDIAEIRLDLLREDGKEPEGKAWADLIGMPLLFTARRQDEGGALPLNAQQRMDLLNSALDDASLIDIEIASIKEMKPMIDTLNARNLPWIASYHDFEKLPDKAVIEAALDQAADAGASVFKIAAQLSSPADIARLADFQRADHGIAKSTMGMGPLAPVSRLLCAQYGSVLNYGFMGSHPTAPGQWDAATLKRAVADISHVTANQ